jgi:hypothetical protein
MWMTKLGVVMEKGLMSVTVWMLVCVSVWQSSWSFNVSVPISLPRPVHANSLAATACHVNYKVYVYDIAPALLQPAIQARADLSYHVCQKCIYEQFALEFVVNDYFTQFCGRTYDPEEADFFYLPLTRDLDYRLSMSTGRGKVSSPVENLLLSVLEKQDFSQWREILNVTDHYWRRFNGSDHILVMPAPVTNFRHQSNMRGFFHYVSDGCCDCDDCGYQCIDFACLLYLQSFV